ncbi:MAG: 3-oxoacyl-ACP reductase FabG [Bacilli bacterium]|nr:3-oxoacyl-ACP reductase FabG [Bacilli bacterium]
MNFNDKVALVTGSSKGIGRSTILEFARLGCNVVINYNNSEYEALELKEEVEKTYNVKALAIKCDISNEEEVKNMINEIINVFGKLDILVNNAGIAIDTTFEDKTVENFRRTLDVNLIGTFLVSKYASKSMLKNKYGKIINISSTNGIDTTYIESLDYDASKAGVISLTKNLASEFAPYINVNTIAPGWVMTEMNEELDEEFIKDETDKIMLGRFAKPEEIAKVITFLASDDASYINNAVIRVDGGF